MSLCADAEVMIKNGSNVSIYHLMELHSHKQMGCLIERNLNASVSHNFIFTHQMVLVGLCSQELQAESTIAQQFQQAYLATSADSLKVEHLISRLKM